MKWTKRPLVHVPPVTAEGDPTVSIAVGSTTTGAAGTSASVTNVGNDVDAIFNFVIPRGATGAVGPTGPAGVSVGNLDGGFPDSTYGGVSSIDAGGVS